ncbi:MAG TPA: hypothetical protein PKD09_05565 [Aggregatilinea sp.]|jgi:PAS domain-containing protein|uniref:hypothetical protein n=1 Tax=Aggregatilinea sp. TaxID=2806333 RepID=UPI002C6BB779|nr:hypothetical protein [Aggregatilinea sp.]HML21095.1 hypothetical protein [Aggregatilinea sp.]
MNALLDTFFAQFPLTFQAQPVTVALEELAHVVGTQEPVREQPDERARGLLAAGWLKIESIDTTVPEEQRATLVSDVQHAARNWLKQMSKVAQPPEREQVRWMVEKTRAHESKQQITQRIWLAMVLYNMGCRNLRFDADGQILYDDGAAGRIGLAPDAALDLAWSQPSRQIYTASFRHPNGTIARGKGRHRWYVYRLRVAPEADFLFERHAKAVQETIALIVASENHATQPQLPRNFYGGNEFQQACIDAQDAGFTHMLVLSPQHGVVSLDDLVPSDQPWDYVLDHRIWRWQIMTVQRLGAALFGSPKRSVSTGSETNWWAWLNPNSHYDLTLFGGGFAVSMLLSFLSRSKERMPDSWPEITVIEQRPGYDTGTLDEDLMYDFEEARGDGFGDYDDLDDISYDEAESLDQLLDWASDFAETVTIYIPPTGETRDLAPDEALIPTRLLLDSEMDIDDLLELLSDMSLLLEQRLPITMLFNASMIVSTLLQITHSLVHEERDAVPELLATLTEPVLHQYIESAMQEPSREDQLCACLTLAEQLQLVSIAIPKDIANHLLVWFQTYLSTVMRQQILGKQ